MELVGRQGQSENEMVREEMKRQVWGGEMSRTEKCMGVAVEAGGGTIWKVWEKKCSQGHL